MDQSKDQKNTLLLKAYFYLQFRLRTILEMQQYLQKKAKQLSFPKDIVQKVVEQLLEEKYLDDEKFIQEYVRSRSNTNPKGNYAIKQELMQKGIPEDMIQKALENSETDEITRALLVLRKKQSTLSRCTHIKKFQKAMAFLKRRGFSFDTAQKAYAQYIQDNTIETPR